MRVNVAFTYACPAHQAAETLHHAVIILSDATPVRKKKTISSLRDEKFPFPGVSFPLPPECFGRLPPGTSRILCEGRKVAPSGHTRFRWRRPSYPCQLPVIKRIPASNHSRWHKKGGLYFEDNHDLWNPFRISGNSWLTKWLTILVPPVNRGTTF